jgi:hypothetical protein
MKQAMNIWMVMALAALPLATAHAAEPPKDVGDHAQVERYIRASEAEWAAVEVTRDTAPLRTFLADDYQGVSSHSVVVDKAHELVPPGLSDIVSDTLDYVRLRYASPEVIIAQGGETAVAKDGKRTSLIWTDTWMLRSGRWQIVTSQDSRLAEPYRAK